MIACDVSEYQPVVDNSYPHKWLIFRAFDGTYLDRNFQANLAWAKAAKVSGRLNGYTVYFVWEPGDDPIGRLDSLGVPRDCHLMIDVESWGRISGDHSAELTGIANRCAARQGSQSRVWGYFNQGDGASLFPNRPAWLGIVIACYGRLIGYPNMVGQQYTDGQPQYAVPGLPSSSPPFGACDHNQIGGDTGLGGGVPLSTDWFDMATPAELETALRNVLNEGTGAGLKTWAQTSKAILAGIQTAFNEENQTQASLAAVAAKIPSVDALVAGVHAELAKVPPAAGGGVTAAQVETAVRNVLHNA